MPDEPCHALPTIPYHTIPYHAAAEAQREAEARAAALEAALEEALAQAQGKGGDGGGDPSKALAWEQAAAKATAEVRQCGLKTSG